MRRSFPRRVLADVFPVRLKTQSKAVVIECHRYPEWIKNQPPEGSKQDISLHDILDALGMAENEERLVEEEQTDAAFEEALASVREV